MKDSYSAAVSAGIPVELKISLPLGFQQVSQYIADPAPHRQPGGCQLFFAPF
jgi:hypothetical protein